MFIKVEEDHEQFLREKKKLASLDLIDAKKYIVNVLMYNRDKNHTKAGYLRMASRGFFLLTVRSHFLSLLSPGLIPCFHLSLFVVLLPIFLLLSG